jgi:hypothetical protein
MANGIWGVGPEYHNNWNSPQLIDPSSPQYIGPDVNGFPTEPYKAPEPPKPPAPPKADPFTPSPPAPPQNDNPPPGDGGGGGGGGGVNAASSGTYDGGGMAAQLRAAYDALKNAPDMIEKLRLMAGKQFMAGMQPMQNYYQPAMDQMASRGILNSSITGDALGGIQDNINRAYEQALAGANTQAAQNNYDWLKSMPGVAAGVLAALNDLERVNQGWAITNAQVPYINRQTELMPWQTFLPYM